MAQTKLKFLIAEKKPLATQLGCNIMEGGERNLAAMIPLTKALGMKVFYYNLISGVKNETSAAQVISFLKETGARLGIFLPIWKTTAPDYFDWLVKTFGAYLDFIQLDEESISNPAGMTHTKYVMDSRTAMARYPQYKYSWDLGLFYRYPNKEHVARNNEIAKQPAPPDEGRQYAHLADIVKTVGPAFTKDQLANIELIKIYSIGLFPTYLFEFKRMGNIKRQNVLQFLIENAGENLLSDAVTNYAISEYLVQVFKNTESFARVFFMQIAGLMARGVPTREYDSFKRIMPATKMRYVVPLDIKMDGVTGVGFTDGVDNFSALLNTSTTKEETIATNEIKIFGKKIQTAFTNDCGGAEDWDSTVENRTVAAGNVMLKGCGVNVITFSTAAPA